MTYYAWSTFRTEVNEWGQPTKTLMPGAEVTQEALGISDTEWAYLIETGAVREDEHPDIDASVAPAEHWAQNPPETGELSMTAEAQSEPTTPDTEEELAAQQGDNPENTEQKQPWQQ